MYALNGQKNNLKKNVIILKLLTDNNLFFKILITWESPIKL
jgi:hypothetical protein